MTEQFPSASSRCSEIAGRMLQSPSSNSRPGRASGSKSHPSRNKLADGQSRQPVFSVIEGLASANARLAALETANHQGTIASLMEDALREKKIFPAEREQYVALCATLQGLERVKTLFAGKLPMLRPSGLDGRPVPGLEAVGKTPIHLAARATRYRDAQTQIGNTITQADAIVFCASHPNA